MDVCHINWNNKNQYVLKIIKIFIRIKINLLDKLKMTIKIKKILKNRALRFFLCILFLKNYSLWYNKSYECKGKTNLV